LLILRILYEKGQEIVAASTTTVVGTHNKMLRAVLTRF